MESQYFEWSLTLALCRTNLWEKLNLWCLCLLSALLIFHNPQWRIWWSPHKDRKLPPWLMRLFYVTKGTSAVCISGHPLLQTCKRINSSGRRQITFDSSIDAIGGVETVGQRLFSFHRFIHWAIESFSQCELPITARKRELGQSRESTNTINDAPIIQRHPIQEARLWLVSGR